MSFIQYFTCTEKTFGTAIRKGIILIGSFLFIMLSCNVVFSMGFFGKKEKKADSKIKKDIVSTKPKEEEIIVSGAEIVRFGLYEAEMEIVAKKEEPPAKKPAPADKKADPGKKEEAEPKKESAPPSADAVPPKDKIKLKSYKFKSETDVIPSKKGVFFGFEYVLKGNPEGKKITLTVKDEIRAQSKKPDQSETLLSSNTIEETKIGDISLIGYQFNFREDLFSGTWTFSLIHNDQKLAEKTFIIQKPELSEPDTLEPGELPPSLQPEEPPEGEAELTAPTEKETDKAPTPEVKAEKPQS